jgi:hypothetical protein
VGLISTITDLGIVVVHLFRVEIHATARRHGVADEDIEHAVAQAIAWVELGEDPPRFLLAGPDRAGNLLEVVVLVVGDAELVIHAMRLRTVTERELFGEEG